MGYFGIVKDGNQAFEIEACHINFWLIRGSFVSSVFVLDVGLHVKVGDIPLDTLNIALPFGTEKTIFDKKPSLLDLSPEVLNPTTAKLIFGSEVSIHERRVTTEGRDFLVYPVDVTSCTLEERWASKDYSAWRIKLTLPIPAGENGYFRMRFYLNNVSRVWTQKRSGQGAILDFRIADIRETVKIENWDGFHDRLVPIQNLYLFVVVPSSLVHQAESPPLRYIRLLEGTAWEIYLRRKQLPPKHCKLVVYYWREKEPVNANNPFRAYLNLSAERDLATTVHLLLLFAAITLALYFLVPVRVAEILRHPTVDNTPDGFWLSVWQMVLREFIAPFGPIIGGTGVIFVVIFVVNTMPNIIASYSATKGLCGWISNLIRRYDYNRNQRS